MNLAIKNALRKARRLSAEFFGIPKYSRPALYNLDSKLEKYLNYDNGVFIEAGANDGFTQSNTYYFEKMRGWTGILVEAIPQLYEKCRRERRRSRVFNCALVSDTYADDFVVMNYANLMSTANGAFHNSEKEASHIQQGLACAGLKEGYEIKVPARTLTSVLTEARIKSTIDLLSLDVEGYEIDVLQGLDFTEFRPLYICIEVWNEPAVGGILLHNRYEKVEVLSDAGTYKDILYRAL